MFNLKLYKKANLGLHKPRAFDLDFESKQRHPYRKNDPLRGEGWDLHTFGDESTSVGGSNSREPDTVSPGTNERSRENNPYSDVRNTIPSGSTILDKLDSNEKNTPGTNYHHNFYTQNSPLGDRDIANPRYLDRNNFQSLLNGSSIRDDIVDSLKKRKSFSWLLKY